MPKVRVVKSEAIRTLVAQGVTDASTIVSRLRTDGITVSNSQVYGILSKMRHKTVKGHAAPSKRLAAARAAAAIPRSLMVISKVGEFVSFCGGFKNAKMTIDMLERCARQ